MTSLVDKSQSPKMFDSIASRYDFLNQFISLGRHQKWRAKMLSHLPDTPHMKVLDLATGTADVALALGERRDVAQVVGMDMSAQMLSIGQCKVAKSPFFPKITLEAGDAQNTHKPSASFDAVTMAFGIRNVSDPIQCLKEMHRVLAPGGRAIILESGHPRNGFLRLANKCALKIWLPLIGALLSKNKNAYRYLDETIRSFPYGHQFVSLMSSVGFHKVGFEPLLFGSVYIYWGER